MTLREREFVFAEEIERLEGELQDIATDVADLPDGAPDKRQLLARGQRLDSQLAGVRWAASAHEDEDVAVWDRDAESVTLAGLTGSEYGRLEDELAGDENAGTGASRVLLVADATVDAPYADGRNDTERVGATGQLPIAYLKWAEARVNELMGTGDEGNAKSFGDFLAAAQTDATSPGE